MQQELISRRAVSGRAAQSFEDRRSPLSAHRFSVGQTVHYTSNVYGRPGATGPYRIIKLLPAEGDDCQYRIKSVGEAFERVAKESQLDRDF
jgi:hypothetical protein